MHYAPESSREFLPVESGGTSDDRNSRSFHYRSAPIYLLTAVVGVLLLADVALGIVGSSPMGIPPTVLPIAPSSDWWAKLLTTRMLFGFRLALLAAVLGGARILYQTLDGLLSGKVGADLALTIACLAAIVLGEHTTAALVVFIALCGESIEGYTVDRAQRAIRRIFQLCPRTARVLVGDNEQEIPVEQVVEGDMLVVRPGERMPVDGVIAAGQSAVDQSALTGESVPVDKGIGDAVFAGTLNQFGALRITATKVGQQTTIAQIVELVAMATQRKAPLERTADRLARWFLPIVLGVAALTLVGWRIATGTWAAGYLPALSVLVVACPCPLILATPSAVMAAMAWLARTGVVVKGSLAMERLAAVDTFVFDKTGTLTRGELAVGDMWLRENGVGSLFQGGDSSTSKSNEPSAALKKTPDPFASAPTETDLLRLAAIAEKRSEHPIARVLVREAEARQCVITGADELTAHPGAGVVAVVRNEQLGAWADFNSRFVSGTALAAGELAQLPVASAIPLTLKSEITVGNRRLMTSRNINIPADVEQRLSELEQQGQSVLLVALEQQLLGAIGLRDVPRAETAAVLNELREAGVRQFAMLTGDRYEPARRIAEQLGIDNVEAELLPADKAKRIEELLAAGRIVAMVGDGVNDAPALATASVGLALGGVGSDLAAEAGDLVLMGDPLRPLPGLLRLSRQLVTVIRQSIFVFAFGMNAIGMLLGSLGWINPAVAAVFHEFSSLAVMLNALRLLWFERWDQTWLGRLSISTAEIVDWATERLSPTRLVFGFLDHWPTLVRSAVAVLGVWWCCSGIVLLSEDEQAVITRLGRFETTLEAGWHWRWPVGLERIRRERVGELRAIQLGFRSSPSPFKDSGLYRAPVEWVSEHADGDYEPVAPESFTLTGEEVPIEVTGEVQFRIGDLRQFAFAVARPDETLRAVSESVLREVMATESLDAVLTDRRREIAARSLKRIRELIAAYQIGLEVLDLNLLDIHPPKQVVPAYRQVADALEQREQFINEAEGYYARKVLSAAGERAIRVLTDSVNAARRLPDASTTGGVTAWRLDDAVWQRLTENFDSDDRLLSGEAAAKLLTARRERTRTVQAATGAAARFDSVLKVFAAQPTLTGLHLYWTTIEQVLAARPLMILDPALRGRQHLWLTEPGLSPPLPLSPAPQRLPPVEIPEP